jgi:lysophospholipase L1-like esterase
MPKIQFKRGLEANLPVLAEGEPGFTTDSEKLFIGSTAGNVEVARKDHVDDVQTDLQGQLDTHTNDISNTNTRIDNLKLVDANAEVLSARGTYPLLGNRMDDIATSLADIATKQGDLTQLNTTDKTSIVNALKEIKTQANTNATAVSNIGNGSPKGVYPTVTALQNAFPTGNSNVYVVTGNIKEVDTLTVSTIPTTAGNITIYLNGVGTTVAVDPATDTTPTAVATKIRNTAFSGWTTGGTGATVTFTKTTAGVNTAPSFNAGTTGMTATFTVTTAGVNADGNWYYWNNSTWVSGGAYQSSVIPNGSVTPDKTSFIKPGKNLFDKTAVTTGYFVHGSNGNLYANANYFTSDYIPVTPNTQYYNTTPYYAFYDSNKTYISGLNNATAGAITSPTNAAFIRISSNVGIDTLQFELGSAPTTYEAYGRYLDVSNVKDKSISSSKFVTNWNTKKWSAFGDSITYQNKWQPYVVSALGLVSSNFGVSGTTISDVSGTDTTAMCRDERINAIDINSDLITVLGGTNDWAQNVPMGKIDDQAANTFYGALNVMCKKLIARYPTKRIILLTTTFGKMANRYSFPDKYGIVNSQGFTTGDYGNAIIAVGRLYGIPVVDIFGNAGWNDVNLLTYVTDDTNGVYIHPNDAGARRMAELVIGKLKSIEPTS